MARRPLTDAEVERVRELHNQGLSRNQIAASIGRSWSSVTKLARIAGVKFDRAAPKAAIEARVIDGKVRRRGIIERLYSQAEKQLARLERDQHDMSEVSMGAVVRYRVIELPGADVYRLVGAIGSATSNAVKLEQVDNDNGANTAIGMVGALFAGLKATYDQLPENGADGDSNGGD